MGGAWRRMRLEKLGLGVGHEQRQLGRRGRALLERRTGEKRRARDSAPLRRNALKFGLTSRCVLGLRELLQLETLGGCARAWRFRPSTRCGLFCTTSRKRETLRLLGLLVLSARNWVVLGNGTNVTRLLVNII